MPRTSSANVIRRTTLVQGPAGPPGATGATGPQGAPGQDFQKIVNGDSPSVAFASRTDNAPEVNAWIAANPGGGILRLINATFKTSVDFSPLTSSLVVEVVGNLYLLVNGGEVNMLPGVKIVGKGGGGNAQGDFKVKANVFAYAPSGVIQPDLRMGGTGSFLTGPFYVADFIGYPSNVGFGFPTNTYSDALIGQTLQITSGGDGSAVGNWTIVGCSLSGPQNAGSSKGTGIRAVWTGGGVPTVGQTGLNWSIPSIPASGGTLGLHGQIAAMKLNGVSLAAPTVPGNVWKNLVYISNASQTWMNGAFRILGTDNNTHLFLANSTALDSVYQTAETLPEYGTGGSSGAPTVHYQIVSALFRMEGAANELQDLTLSGCPVVGVMIDGSKAVTASVLLEGIGFVSQQDAFSQCLWLDNAFEVYVRDCAFFPWVPGTPVIPSAFSWSVVLGGSSTLTNSTSSIVYLDDCKFNFGGVLIQNQGGAKTVQGQLRLENPLTESQQGPLVGYDPRSGPCSYIVVRNGSINDPLVSPLHLIDGLVPGKDLDISTIKVEGGELGEGFSLIGPNIARVKNLEIRQQDTFTGTAGYTLGSQTDFIHERGNRLDAVLKGSAASFSPSVDFGFSETLADPSTWSAQPGAGAVSFPDGLLGPDGQSNTGGSQTVPVMTSSSGTQGKTILDVTVTPAVGDYLLVGGWIQTQDATKIVPTQASGVFFVTSGVTLSNGTSQLFLFDDGCSEVTGAWRYAVSWAKVASTNGGSKELRYIVQTDTSTATAFKNLWFKYIPASSGISEREILRWARHGSRSTFPGVGRGNLGVGQDLKLDWGGRATLGSSVSGQLETNASSLVVGGSGFRTGSGSPNGQVTGSPGDFYSNADGGKGTTLWVKASGTATNTGWVAVGVSKDFDPTSLSGCALWMRMDSSVRQTANRVSALEDQSRFNRDFVQATAGFQPLYLPADINGHDAIQLDSVARYLQALSLFSVPQPSTIWLVMKSVSWGSANRILDTVGGASFVVNQFGTTPQLQLYAGSAFACADGDLAVGSYGIVQIQANGASSFIQVGSGTQDTGSPGSNGWGASLACQIGTSNGNSANVALAEILMFDHAQSSGDQTTTLNGLKALYNL